MRATQRRGGSQAATTSSAFPNAAPSEQCLEGRFKYELAPCGALYGTQQFSPFCSDPELYAVSPLKLHQTPYTFRNGGFTDSIQCQPFTR
jgi:hypothetical protein